MDITVTRAFSFQRAWTLTDLLGRPLGHITEEPGQQFFIDPNPHGRDLMPRLAPGPHPSLDAALTEIEKRTHGICHHAPEEG
jgi:hypothetical protein